MEAGGWCEPRKAVEKWGVGLSRVGARPVRGDPCSAWEPSTAGEAGNGPART